MQLQLDCGKPDLFEEKYEMFLRDDFIKLTTNQVMYTIYITAL